MNNDVSTTKCDEFDESCDPAPGPGPRHRVSVARHVRKCTVCRHADRAAIEEEFMNWTSPEIIARRYGIADHSSVYRHVRATGLRAKRAAPARVALESIIERGDSVSPTASAVVRAVWAYAHINDEGRWVEPKKEIRIIREIVTADIPNRQPCRAENLQAAENKREDQSLIAKK